MHFWKFGFCNRGFVKTKFRLRKSTLTQLISILKNSEAARAAMESDLTLEELINTIKKKIYIYIYIY